LRTVLGGLRFTTGSQLRDQFRIVRRIGFGAGR